MAHYDYSKTLPEQASPASDRDEDFQRIDPESGVKRGLKTRHLSMMALAGIIGPGLLVGSGGALASGGPASLIIGFGIIGIIAFSIMQSLGELTTLYPTGGAFTQLSDRFVDKAFGVAVGWNYWLIWGCVLANEYNVVSSILVFWSDRIPLWGYFLVFWFFFLGFQMLGVESFGEAEFWLALLKLGGLCAYFVFAIIYASGGLIGQKETLGFRYWHDPGPFVSGFRGVATVFVFCSTFYAGVESVAVAATETKNPIALSFATAFDIVTDCLSRFYPSSYLSLCANTRQLLPFLLRYSPTYDFPYAKDLFYTPSSLLSSSPCLSPSCASLSPHTEFQRTGVSRSPYSYFLHTLRQTLVCSLLFLRVKDGRFVLTFSQPSL